MTNVDCEDQLFSSDSNSQIDFPLPRILLVMEENGFRLQVFPAVHILLDNSINLERKGLQKRKWLFHLPQNTWPPNATRKVLKCFVSFVVPFRKLKLGNYGIILFSRITRQTVCKKLIFSQHCVFPDQSLKKLNRALTFSLAFLLLFTWNKWWARKVRARSKIGELLSTLFQTSTVDYFNRESK
jgi:hypothetical protein